MVIIQKKIESDASILWRQSNRPKSWLAMNTCSLLQFAMTALPGPRDVPDRSGWDVSMAAGFREKSNASCFADALRTGTVRAPGFVPGCALQNGCD